MSTIQVIADIIRFDGYDVAQIDPNLPATVRQRFEVYLREAESVEEAYEKGYNEGYEDAG